MGRALALSFLVMFLASPTVFGVDHTVGDSAGWALNTDYSTWASGKTFTVGDNLVFNYDSSTHQVDQVDKSGYDGCSSSNIIKNYNDGNSKVPLTKEGKVYFICPTPGHCSGGMKLEINVVAASTTPTTPTTPSGGSSPPTTPSNPSPSTPSGSGTTPAATPPAAPSPKTNAAVSVSSGITHLVGSLVVAAIGLGFMG
ncbi:hypothetical protein RIF29_18320 [Crotalaria pallida]|uniref:Phytocyanin domain-containing protein n=1 Tax=Crotalaria pallida TaxID=3830 RepID=A0AAN9FIV1_CROPI